MNDMQTRAAAWHEIVLATLKSNNVKLITYVPDKVFTPLIKALHGDPFFTTFATTREEEAIGIVTGAAQPAHPGAGHDADGFFLARRGESGEKRIAVQRLDQRREHLVGDISDEFDVVALEGRKHDLVPGRRSRLHVVHGLSGPRQATCEYHGNCVLWPKAPPAAAPPHPTPLLPVSYTHLRAHETVLDLVCRLLLEKK